MKRPIKIYFDRMAWQLVITNKKLNWRERYAFISSHENTANAEVKAERLTEDDGEIFRPALDRDLVSESYYSLSPDDISVYCIEL